MLQLNTARNLRILFDSDGRLRSGGYLLYAFLSLKRNYLVLNNFSFFTTMVISYIYNMKIEDSHNLKFKSEQQKAVVNIRITSNFIGNKQHQWMSQFDLSMAQFNVLRILRGAKTQLSVHVVKERMIEKSPNTTRLMDKLIEKEFIARTRCEHDKRIVFVEITEKGLELLLRIDEKLDEVIFISNGLTNEEAETLNTLLDKVREKW